jgi:flagellin-specific chaperone FliS
MYGKRTVLILKTQYHFMVNKKFNALRKKLPKQYGKLIAANLDGISNRQVHMVFNGEITNPTVVEQVIDEARRLAARLRRINRKSTIRKRPKSHHNTKPRV